MVNKQVAGFLKTLIFLFSFGVFFCELNRASQFLWAEDSQDISEEQSEVNEPEISPSIIPLPNQTIQRAGMNAGLSKAFCEGVGLKANPEDCLTQGCSVEKAQVNTRESELPARVVCYECQNLNFSSCCPNAPSVVRSGSGSSCQYGCSEKKHCHATCPGQSSLVSGVSADQDVECCKCSDIVGESCDDQGAVRSTTCGQGDGIADLRFKAREVNQCSDLVVMGGGKCMPKCTGDGVECGAT